MPTWFVNSVAFSKSGGARLCLSSSSSCCCCCCPRRLSSSPVRLLLGCCHVSAPTKAYSLIPWPPTSLCTVDDETNESKGLLWRARPTRQPLVSVCVFVLFNPALSLVPLNRVRRAARACRSCRPARLKLRLVWPCVCNEFHWPAAAAAAEREGARLARAGIW